MPLALPSHSAALLLLLAACGPGLPEPGGTEGAGGDGSVGGSATGDTPTGGQQTPTDRLIGLGFVEANGAWNTLALDRATGELTVLATMPKSIIDINTGCGTFDPATRRIFHPTGDGHLLIIDADSGQFIAAPSLGPGGPIVLYDLAVNGAGALVGLIPDTPQLVKIDPDTGAVTPLPALPEGLGAIDEGTGAFDPATNHLFALTDERHLLEIDADDGSLVGDVLLAQTVADVRDLTINNDGELVGLGTPASAGPWLSVRVDPSTGIVTSLGELSGGSAFLHGQCIHDPAVDHMFLLTTEPNLLTIDADNGELVAVTPVSLGDHLVFANIVFVP